MATANRPDRAALVQAAMGRGRGGGGGGAEGFAAAIQQFMASFGQAMNKMTTQIGKASEMQAREGQQQMANVANMAEMSYNQAMKKADTQHAEARQDAATQNAREYQLQASDYQAALNKQVESEAKEVALLLTQQQQAQQRVIHDHERSVATVQDAGNQAFKWIYNMDATNGWNQLGAGGLKLREDMLQLTHTSRALAEDYDNSPYMDKFFALKEQADKDIIAGSPEYQSLSGTRPPQMLIPVPESMTHAKDLDLPVYSKQEIADMELRNGYPKDGLWAMQVNNPDGTPNTKTLLVNPVGFRALMAARQEDTAMALLSSAAAKQDFLIKRGKEAKGWKDYSDKQEELQTNLRSTLSDVVPDVISKAMRPPARTAGLGGGETIAPADLKSLLYSFYGGMLKDSDAIEKLKGLGLSEGDPKRWVPGDHPELADPGEKAARAGEDSPHAWKLTAAERALTSYLDDEAHNGDEIRAQVSHWIAGLTPAQVHQIGLREETANKIAIMKQVTPMQKVGLYAQEIESSLPIVGGWAKIPGEARRAMVDATFEVVGKLRSLNRDLVRVPLDTSPVMRNYRDSNHAYEVLTDGHALAAASTMDPADFKTAAAGGFLPAGLNQGEEGLFRRPIGVTQSIVTITGRPGARTAIKDYARGGPGPEEEKVFKSPEFNKVQGYYEHVSEHGFGPASVNVSPELPGVATTRPYLSLTERLHASRAKALLTPEQPAQGQAPSAQVPVPQQTNAPAPPPAVGSPPMGEVPPPMGTPDQLAPQPQIGPPGIEGGQ